MQTLAVLLQRERLLLELLVFKITEMRHLLAAGDARFLGWAAEEVERAVDAVRSTELERAVMVTDCLAAQLGDADLGVAFDDEAALLDRLAEAADEPWSSVLAEHRTALTVLTGEVAEGLAAARRLADAGATAVADLLDRVDGPVAEPALLTCVPQRHRHLVRARRGGAATL
jgi:hypothetical protein